MMLDRAGGIAAAAGAAAGLAVSAATAATPLGFIERAAGAALLLAAARTLALRSVPARVANLVTAAMLPLAFFPPDLVLAIGLAVCAIPRWMSGPAGDAGSAAFAIAAGMLSAPIGAVAVGALWWREISSRSGDLAAAIASLAIVATHPASWARLGATLAGLAVAAVLLRRAAGSRALAQGGQRAGHALAAACLPLGLAALLALDGRTFSLGRTDVLAAFGFAAAAIGAGALLALVVEGTLLLFATTHDGRRVLLGWFLSCLVCAAVYGAPVMPAVAFFCALALVVGAIVFVARGAPRLVDAVGRP